MIRVLARAPGKLFLTGEYAVLCGAPALVAAVDRHAEVEVRLDAGSGPLRVVSRTMASEWTIADPEREEETGGDLGAALAALRVASAWAPTLAGRCAEIVIESGAFLLDGQKLGLGRSAATVTAAVDALFAAAGQEDPEKTSEAAVAAHALFQEGRGSGADVVASASGGVVEFRRTGGRLSVVPRALPAGLELVVGWTGEGAPTDPFVRRFASEAAIRGPAALTEVVAVAERACAAVAEGDARGLCRAVDETTPLLDRLGRELGIPIVTATLARLVAIAREAGGVAKPSGAGGGDCGIAFATSSAQADDIRARWSAAGIVPLPLAVAAHGVRHERLAATQLEVPVA
jgi:phosphomevalonate kinase